MIFESGKLKIVENRKKILLVPIVIVLITIISMVIYAIALGTPVNVGTDFTGGYKMRIKLGDKLTDATYEQYSKEIVSLAEGLEDANGNVYGIKVAECNRYGTENDSIEISYQRVTSDEGMEDVNKELEELLKKEILTSTPAVTYTNNTIVANYEDIILNGNIGQIKVDALKLLGVNVADYSITASTLTINLNAAVADEMKESVEETLSWFDEYAYDVSSSGFVSSTVSSELLQRAILAVVVAIVCMLIYIWIRFALLSGLASIIALFHDLIIMMCGMIIFHIEINQTIIAALITILGYSINNTIIIFDRVRENTKSMPGVSNATIVNNSVSSTMSRTLFSSLTTLLMILFVAIFGVTDIQIFAMPIIFGMLAGFYSANFIAPSIWAWLSDGFGGRGSGKKSKKA